MFLVVADAHSKWIEVIPMNTATAELTVQHLWQLFTRFGVPESSVLDNGPQFVAEEFEQFCHLNGVKHIHVAPYHPLSNGLAERAVQVIKQGFRKTSTGTVLPISYFITKLPLTLPLDYLQQRCFSVDGSIPDWTCRGLVFTNKYKRTKAAAMVPGSAQSLGYLHRGGECL